MSPTGFSISVHNAIGALFSIAQADKSNYIALSAGARTPIAALVEALGLLQDGAPEVLLVMYEQTLAPDYQQFADGPSANYAWAWRITRPIGTEARIELSIKNAKIPPPAGLPTTIKLPPGLELMRFFLSHDTTLDDTSGPTHWEWKKHA